MNVAQDVFAKDLNRVLKNIQDMLISKNRKYGDAALNPQQTFSRSSPIELINIRMDDKLSRIRNAQTDEDEDPELDLLGYLLLKQIAKIRFQHEAAHNLKQAEAKRLAEMAPSCVG